MDLPFDVDEEPPEPSPGSTLAASVLLVDDEPIVLDVFAHLFDREPDIDLTCADSFETAVAHLQSRRFDLLIADKNLPTRSGIELVASARELRPGIEAIVITGFASAESVIAAFAAGASDYLTKPFDELAVVLAKVRAALDRRAARVQGRHEARQLARGAAELLAKGNLAADATWDRLERQLGLYENSIRQGGVGLVAVVGNPKLAGHLLDEGFVAEALDPASPELERSDVVVIDTEWPGWLPLAERLAAATPDVLLVARAHADLGDLLEAITLKVDLVGFGAEAGPTLLPGRLKALLMRRAVQHAQAALSVALTDFRAAIGKKSG
jgi:DNA-binding response OmpR family regulator